MSVEIKLVVRRKDLRTFIFLPEQIHRGHRNWVPPIYHDEKTYFNDKKNKAFSCSDTVLALAYQQERPVGRIMGIINRRYNAHRNEKNARFGCLECWDSQDVAHALLAYVENWAREKGMEKIVGPMGFSDQDPEGFLVEGFDEPPALASTSNFEYMIRLLGNEGYEKEVDYVVYKIDLDGGIPNFYERIFQRTSQREEFTLVEFAKRKGLKPFILPIFRLMNDCFKDIYGYMPLNEDEMKKLAKRYLPLVDPRFIKIVTRNSEVVAFIIGVPNMSEGIRKARGRLFPLGLFKILKAAKRSKQLDLLLGGIHENYRGIGLDVLLGYKTMETARRGGMEYIDSHHELETNVKMRAEMERIGGRIYKRFRIFQKKLI